MKKQLLFFAALISFLSSFASHITGGDMRFVYKGPGVAPNSKIYTITLRLFRDNDCVQCAAMPSNVFIGIFSNDTNNEFPSTQPFIVNKTIDQRVPINAFPPCLVNPPDLNYSVGEYPFDVELPDNANGYTAAYQTCCRVVPLQNVANTITGGANPGGTGSTYSCVVPGTKLLNGLTNSSANFNTVLSVICQNKPFTFDFSATDPENDSLVYSFADAYDGGQAISANNINPDPPPYHAVNYINGFSAGQPLGVSATINPGTGIITGIAPGSGKYVVCVKVDEYRKGIFIGSSRKDFIVNVASCDYAGAQLDPKAVTCDGFNVQFSNANNSPLNQTYYWDFGEPKSGTKDTSTSPTPSHLYTDTGVYVFKLVVNRGLPCADSATQIVKVYPGFSAGFTISSFCKDIPITFTDTTKTSYGFVNSWKWDFGNAPDPNSTSTVQNPVYTFHTAGTYNLVFTVTNSKGCTSTINKPLTIISNPVITAQFKDTSYCGKDSIQLSATSNFPVKYSWSPLTNIINPNTATPTVFPTVSTSYIVTGDAGGCFGKDTVTVTPKNDFATKANASAVSICEDDTLSLTATSNYNSVKYLWSPDYNILHKDSSVAMAFPAHDTTYTVTGRWGNNCTSSASVFVKVKQLAKPVAGPSQAFCNGTSGVQLNATGGDEYVWSPSTGLSNSNIPNPIANPSSTTEYVVSVGVTGCSKKRLDSLLITVRPNPVFTKTNDTLICSIDTLQLNASSPGGGQFIWTPAYNIINPNSAAPQVYPKFTTRYYVQLTDPNGCVNKDSVLVNVKQFVTIHAGNDTAICRTDTIQLNPTSDALHFKWRPSGPLDNDTAKYPKAAPLTTTRFYVIANIGKCQSSDSVLVKVAPYPSARASQDTSVCFGDTVHLHASGGSVYLWSPPFNLSNTHIPDPLATPDRNIRYQVRITDTLGCPKPVYDTVFIRVFPKIFANAGPDDTSIVALQPLQLFGSGGSSYLWSPATGLDNPAKQNPIATVSSDITYLLKVSNEFGCSAFDSIRVRVYTVVPGVYVPNAFTPNRDGRNDVFRPVAIGIKKINYFKVYDRWGQLMYSTTEVNKGWDGTFKGKPQDAAVYVWIVQAVDFTDKITTQKGTVVLIR